MKKVGLLIFLIGIIGLMGMAVVAQDETPQSPIITPENVTQIQELQMLGRGNALETIFSPDGTMLAVASSIGIWLYNFNDLEAEPRLLEGNVSSVASTNFSPDGQFIASGSYDDTLRIWDVATGEIVRIIQMPQDDDLWRLNSIASLTYSPDGRFIATGFQANPHTNEPRPILIWDIETGEIIQHLTGHTRDIRSLTYSLDGHYLVGGGVFTLCIWDVQSRELLKCDSSQQVNVNDVVYSRDGESLFVGTKRGTLLFWDVETWQATQTIETNPNYNNSQVVSVDYNPNEQYVVTGGGGDDTNIRIWNIETGENTLTFIGYPDGNLQVDYSPDGRYIVSTHTSMDNGVIVWDVQTGEQHHILKDHFYQAGILYSPDGEHLLSNGKNNIRIWDTQTWEIIHTLTMDETAIEGTMIYNPDGQFLATTFVSPSLTSGDDYPHIQIWDSQTWELYQEFDVISRWSGGQHFGIVYRPNGQLLTMMYLDFLSQIRIYDVISEDYLYVIQVLDDNYGKKIVFSPDRKRIALYSLGYGGSGIEIYDGDTGEFLYTLLDPTSNIQTLNFSPDGKFIIFSVSDHTIRIVDVETGEEEFMLNGHVGHKVCANYSSDGQFITSYSSVDGELWIWDAQTGEQLYVIDTNHIERWMFKDFYNVGCGVFSPDGRTLAFSVGGTIRIWGIPPSSTP